MRILVISQHFWPESFRINEVVESLREAGCEVEVLTGQPNYPDGVVFDGYRARAWGHEHHSSGYMIHRVPLVPRGRGGAFRLATNYLSFVATGSTLGAWLLRGRSFDVIFVYGTSPVLQALVGIVLRASHRSRLVLWVQDLWPQSLEVTGYVRNRRALAAVAGVVRWIYHRCDLVLVQSPAFVAEVQPMAGDTPVAVHPNPGERAFEMPQGGGTPSLRLDAGFNVVFAGNLGAAQALETVIEAATLLRDEQEVRFVLVGSGSRLHWLQQEVAARGLRNVQLPGRFPPEAMPAVLAQASVLLVSLAHDPAMALTVPSKVQAYLAAGRPILASLEGEGARVVDESGAGLTAKPEDPHALADAVRRLRRMPTEVREAMGRTGREYYRQHYRPDDLAQRLLGRLRSLCAEPARSQERNA